jgi:hypothetical protein
VDLRKQCPNITPELLRSISKPTFSPAQLLPLSSNLHKVRVKWMPRLNRLDAKLFIRRARLPLSREMPLSARQNLRPFGLSFRFCSMPLYGR